MALFIIIIQKSIAIAIHIIPQLWANTDQINRKSLQQAKSNFYSYIGNDLFGYLESFVIGSIPLVILGDHMIDNTQLPGLPPVYHAGREDQLFGH